MGALEAIEECTNRFFLLFGQAIEDVEVNLVCFENVNSGKLLEMFGGGFE